MSTTPHAAALAKELASSVATIAKVTAGLQSMVEVLTKGVTDRKAKFKKDYGMDMDKLSS